MRSCSVGPDSQPGIGRLVIDGCAASTGNGNVKGELVEDGGTKGLPIDLYSASLSLSPSKEVSLPTLKFGNQNTSSKGAGEH